MSFARYFAPLGLLLFLIGCAAPGSAPRQEVPAPKAAPEKLDPKANPDSKETRARYKSALEAMRRHRYAEAQQEFELLAKRFPKLAGPRLNLAIALRQQGKADESIATLRPLTSGPAALPEALNQLGVLLREQGKFTEARDAYLAAIQLNPGLARAHLNLGILFDLYLQEFAQAIDHYQRYQALLTKPDRRVSGWILDLRRRQNRKGTAK